MSANSLASFTTIEHTGKQWIPMQEAANMSSRMEHILQAMPSGVILLNGDGVVYEANPVAVELLGEPLEGERWLNIIKRSFAPQDDDGHEVSLRNGRRVKLAMTPLDPEPGQLIVLTDLTETRLLQKNLSHLQRLSALGKMVATLAHQIRTPLSAALLYASNLGSATLQPDSRNRFQQKLVDRLNDLERQVNDMLLMAKGRQDGMAESLQLQTVLHAVMANCEPIAKRQSAVISRDERSEGMVLGNSNALASAIGNLVMNSLEAGASQVALVTREQGGSLILQVIDNGKGLDTKLQQQVLEPFFTTKAQGTGLGLAVVQSVIRNHGGQLQLSCQPGKGCIATVTLPLCQHSQAAEKQPEVI
ncbi:PAS domain-containing sensor histidine kinase [Shewanella corallii]|uniref:histidine kinase n=1 Tax=Shewanella corallii TaxID=560080 RepID=A0ABT0N436_9GAMM|nr:PAS domain-containing sensor histidine kinase [Shewanella corallii]MCL2913125.1 PAS domain-containing sensor histidine kinase [Shewanella corallii]